MYVVVFIIIRFIELTGRGTMSFRFLISVSVIFLLFTRLCFGQPADTLWTNTFGGTGLDRGYSLQQTSDEGFIIAGMTESFGSVSSACYLVKADAYGELEWEQTFDLDYFEDSNSVQQTSDGGYILAGSSGDMPFGAAYIIKTTSAGVLEWENLFGPYRGEHIFGECVRQTYDGGYIIAGSHSASLGGVGGGAVYLLKLNQLGEEEWSGTFGSGGPGAYWYGYAIEQTPDSGYVIAGRHNSAGYVLKLNKSYSIDWDKVIYGYGGSDYNFTSFRSVCVTASGNYLLAGTTSSTGTMDYDVYLVMLDADGELLWERIYGGLEAEGAWSAHQTVDGGFIVAGSTNSYGSGENDVYLLKVNESGGFEWHTWFGGSEMDYAQAVQQTTDGDFAIAGTTRSYGAGSYDVWLLKVGVPEGISDRRPSISSSITLTPFPNPCTGTSQIRYTIPSTSQTEITLFDVSGRLVKTLIDQVQPEGEYTVTWNGSFEDGEEVPGGIYFLNLNAGNLQVSEKIILIR